MPAGAVTASACDTGTPTFIIYLMNPTQALDMLRLVVEDPNGDLHIVWEEGERFRHRIMKRDNSFGPIEFIEQQEIDRLACMAIRSGAMELLESIDDKGSHGYDLVPVDSEWANVIDC